jgi:hypothetical protein
MRFRSTPETSIDVSGVCSVIYLEFIYMRPTISSGLAGLFMSALAVATQAQVAPSAFVNYEIAPIHAMDMSPDTCCNGQMERSLIGGYRSS